MVWTWLSLFHNSSQIKQGKKKKKNKQHGTQQKKFCAFLATSPTDSLPTQIVPQQKQKRNKRVLAAQV